MLDHRLETKLSAYYLTAIASVLFALIGFSYNTWRMEASEDNSNIRTASFTVLKTLAELEQVIYAARYDHDPTEGNPRRGWVRVGLIVDLSTLIDPAVEAEAQRLRDSWSQHWERMATEQASTDRLVAAIDQVRGRVKQVLHDLQ